MNKQTTQSAWAKLASHRRALHVATGPKIELLKKKEQQAIQDRDFEEAIKTPVMLDAMPVPYEDAVLVGPSPLGAGLFLVTLGDTHYHVGLRSKQIEHKHPANAKNPGKRRK